MDFIAVLLDAGGKMDVSYRYVKSLGNLLKLFTSYFSKRRQRVTVLGATSGVPQGLNIDAMLFLLCVNDLPKTVAAFKDTKVLRQVNSMQDTISKGDIENINKWGTKMV